MIKVEKNDIVHIYSYDVNDQMVHTIGIVQENISKMDIIYPISDYSSWTYFSEGDIIGIIKSTDLKHLSPDYINNPMLLTYNNNYIHINVNKQIDYLTKEIQQLQSQLDIHYARLQRIQDKEDIIL